MSRWVAGADIVALPYRRSSASGPLHLAMDAGRPIVITEVGGLREATDGYMGAILVPGADPDAFADGLREAVSLRGVRFEDSGSWDQNAQAVIELIEQGAHACTAPSARHEPPGTGVNGNANESPACVGVSRDSDQAHA